MRQSLKHISLICLFYFLQACSSNSDNETANASQDELVNCVEQNPVLNYTEMPEITAELSSAIFWNDSVAFDSILATGVEVNGVDEYGGTLLAEAVVYDRVSMVDKLIELGANPNITDSDGYTALHIALSQKSDDQAYFVEQLLLAGASVTVVDANGLDLLVWCGENETLKELILNQCHAK